jgi:hypothetical protein
MTPPNPATRSRTAASQHARREASPNRASRHPRHGSGTPYPWPCRSRTPIGRARGSTAQLRRPLFPIARTNSGVQVTRTALPAGPGASPGRGSRWLAHGRGKVVPRRPEIGGSPIRMRPQPADVSSQNRPDGTCWTDALRLVIGKVAVRFRPRAPKQQVRGYIVLSPMPCLPR